MIYRDQESGVWVETGSDIRVSQRIAENVINGLPIAPYVHQCLNEAYKQGAESVQKDTGISTHAFRPVDKVRVLGKVQGVVRAVVLGPNGLAAYRILAAIDERVYEDDYFEHELTLDEQVDEKAD